MQQARPRSDFQDLAGHVGSALTYLIVAACAVAVACTSSRGAAVAARSGVVIAILASPLVMWQGVAVLVEEPDHIGTAAFLLGAFLLIDRAPGWRFTAPLLGVILWIGQVGDATVRYLGRARDPARGRLPHPGGPEDP